MKEYISTIEIGDKSHAILSRLLARLLPRLRAVSVDPLSALVMVSG
jgi:hypothetical protein